MRDLIYNPECYLCKGSGIVVMQGRVELECICEEILILRDKLDQYRKAMSYRERNPGYEERR